MRIVRAALIALLLAVIAPAAASADAWTPLPGSLGALARGAQPEIRPSAFRAFTLDSAALRSELAIGTVAIPRPDGSLERFTVAEDSIMEPGLQAEYPEIRTYAGRSLDEPSRSVRLDLTTLGFHAAVRGDDGITYVDPGFRGDTTRYLAYDRADLQRTGTPLGQDEVAPLERAVRGRAARGTAARAGEAVILRTYRLALLNDPSYAAYFGGSDADVLSAKVALMNRIDQLYIQDLAVKMILIDGQDALNLSTAEEFSGANGPCGPNPCYDAVQPGEGSCDSALLDVSRIAIGTLAGAENFDIGHFVGGADFDGGGIAATPSVGDDPKAEGCTGLDPPVGDGFAVDFTAHEMGHQFSANHTFAGANGSCMPNNGNYPPGSAFPGVLFGDDIASTGVEPGSGTTVMAYAGICYSDDLQPHSDPYFSQRSIEEIEAYIQRDVDPIDEVQRVSLTGFADGTTAVPDADAFKIGYAGGLSDTIEPGVLRDLTNRKVRQAIESIPTLPEDETVTVSGPGDSGQANPTGFVVTFDGDELSGTDVSPLSIVDVAPAPDTRATKVSGQTATIAVGGVPTNQGTPTATDNHAPVVTTADAYTIPAQTPFELSGAASDADGDAPTFLWEENDETATASLLVAQPKTQGPLFRVFGTEADTIATAADYPSAGENAATTDPSREFPDYAQIAAGNTNADTGACPPFAGDPTDSPDPETAACFAEFLPTPAYTGDLHFRLTARDGDPVAGGVDHADTVLTVDPSAGPFAVTSQADDASVNAGADLPVTWDVSGTDAAAFESPNVSITFSTDGGRTWPITLTAATANDGSQTVTVPDVATTTGRVKVQSVGNVFFDVSDGDLTTVRSGAPAPTTSTEPPSPSPSTMPTTDPGGPAATGTPTAPASTATPGTTAPASSSVRFSTSLAGTRARRTVRRSGKFRVLVTCDAEIAGTVVRPTRCAGTLRLIARIRGRKRQLGARRFDVPVGNARLRTLRLSKAARRALPFTAQVITRVENATGGPATDAVAVKLRRAR